MRFEGMIKIWNDERGFGWWVWYDRKVLAGRMSSILEEVAADRWRSIVIGSDQEK